MTSTDKDRVVGEPATSAEPLDLDAIEARANAAAPAPWELLWDSCDCDYPCGHGAFPHALWLPEHKLGYRDKSCADELDAYHHQHSEVSEFSAETLEFIAAAREDVPALVAAVRQLRAELDAARSTVPGPAPTLYRRAAMGEHLLWVHECGHVEAMTDKYRRTEVQGGCDACESGSDNPDDWRPLYVPVDPVVVEEADPGPAPNDAADPLARLVPCDGCRAIIDRWQRKAATEGLDAARPPAVLRDAACRECGGTPLQLPAPTTYALPAEPDGPLWDNISRRWDRSVEGGWQHLIGEGEHRSSLRMAWHDLLDFVAELSSVPPGTEAGRG